LRDEIQKAIEVLIGKPMWNCTRAGDMACFQFGERTEASTGKGMPIQIGEYALHLQCPWRLVKEDAIIMAALDVYHPRVGNEEADVRDFDWEHEPNLLEQRSQELFAEGAQYQVERVEASRAGAVDLFLEGRFAVRNFPGGFHARGALATVPAKKCAITFCRIRKKYGLRIREAERHSRKVREHLFHFFMGQNRGAWPQC
jgi:hypothetical protein